MTGKSPADVKSLPNGTGLSSYEMQMLAAIRHGMQDSVAGEVHSEMAKTVCGFTIEFLDKLLVRHTAWSAILARQNQRMAGTLRQVAALLFEAGGAGAGALAIANDTATRALASTDLSLPTQERIQRELDEGFEQVIPLMLGERRLHAGQTLARVNHLLREQIASIQDSERDFNAALKARVERHVALVDSQVSVSAEALQDYLRSRYPERKNIEVTSFYELPGGSSKSTILIDVRGFENDGITPLVVRLDRVAGSTDTRVIDEVPTLRAMFEQGLPVPEIVLVEPDAGKIGLAFIIVRKVDATLGGSMWHADPQICDADTARDLARILARLHTLDTAKLGLRGALNSDPAVHPMKGLIDNIRHLWAEKKMEPDGTLEACLCWLEQHMPPAPPRPSLIHADVSFHNILVKDRKVASLLDWELSHLGDPAEDLGYGRLCIEQLIPWDEFLTEYRKHGGGEYSEETGRYYGIWRGVRNAVYTLTSQHSFQTNANPDMRWGFFATYYRMVLLEAADKVAQAGMREHAG